MSTSVQVEQQARMRLLPTICKQLIPYKFCALCGYKRSDRLLSYSKHHYLDKHLFVGTLMLQLAFQTTNTNTLPL